MGWEQSKDKTNPSVLSLPLNIDNLRQQDKLRVALEALFQALYPDDIQAENRFDDPTAPGPLWIGGVVFGEQVVDDHGSDGELLSANDGLHVYIRSIVAIHFLEVLQGFGQDSGRLLLSQQVFQRLVRGPHPLQASVNKLMHSGARGQAGQSVLGGLVFIGDSPTQAGGFLVFGWCDHYYHRSFLFSFNRSSPFTMIKCPGPFASSTAF